MVQQYADEEKSIGEDIKHGVILRSKQFVQRLKSKYLSEEPHEEIPQQRMVARGIDLREAAKKSATSLNREMDDFLVYARIPNKLNADRDLIICFLWSTGMYTNKEIVELFNVNYSSISHRVRIFQENLDQKSAEHKRLKHLKSLIQM